MNTSRCRILARGLAWLFFLLSLKIFVGRWLGPLAFITVEYHHPRHNGNNQETSASNLKVLYIVTSLSDKDTGKRSTTQGDDRWTHTLVPVVGQSATSLAQHFAHVQLYLVTHYTVNATQRQTLKDALPSSVTLQIWESATPYGYTTSNVDVAAPSEQQVTLVTRALARQHRYVIKDNIQNYDLFINMEDDMLIHGSQAQAYFDWTQRLYQLRQEAPVSIDVHSFSSTTTPPLERFYGTMTKIMLSRMLPGFIRVEHCPDKAPTPRHQFQQVPVTLTWPGPASDRMQPFSIRRQSIALDPAPCCQMRETTPHISKLLPKMQDIYMWETSIHALGLRQLPDGSWVLLQTGNDESAMSDQVNIAIGEFWTGRTGYFDKQERPLPNEGDFMNNQGGWIATRRQILEWHRLWCRGSFLPPYDAAVFAGDGLSKQTVEFWSGGFQIAGNHGCNLQRMIPLEPDQFAQFLLYHTSNNKQQQKFVRHRFYGRHMQDFWGQLNTIRMEAESQKAKEGGFR